MAHCTEPDCPKAETIDDLHRVVFVGNGSPALTVQISNLATKIETTQRLIMAAMVIIPVLLILFQWGAKAVGITPNTAKVPEITASNTDNATIPKAR